MQSKANDFSTANVTNAKSIAPFQNENGS